MWDGQVGERDVEALGELGERIRSFPGKTVERADRLVSAPTIVHAGSSNGSEGFAACQAE